LVKKKQKKNQTVCFRSRSMTSTSWRSCCFVCWTNRYQVIECANKVCANLFRMRPVRKTLKV